MRAGEARRRAVCGRTACTVRWGAAGNGPPGSGDLRADEESSGNARRPYKHYRASRLPYQRQIDHPIPSGSIFTPQPTRHAREAVEGLTANLTAKHKSGGRSVGLRTHLSWPPAPCIAGQNSRRKRHVQVQELASDKAAGPGREPARGFADTASQFVPHFFSTIGRIGPSRRGVMGGLRGCGSDEIRALESSAFQV